KTQYILCASCQQCGMRVLTGGGYHLGAFTFRQAKGVKSFNCKHADSCPTGNGTPQFVHVTPLPDMPKAVPRGAKCLASLGYGQSIWGLKRHNPWYEKPANPEKLYYVWTSDGETACRRIELPTDWRLADSPDAATRIGSDLYILLMRLNLIEEVACKRRDLECRVWRLSLDTFSKCDCHIPRGPPRVDMEIKTIRGRWSALADSNPYHPSVHPDQGGYRRSAEIDKWHMVSMAGSLYLFCVGNGSFTPTYVYEHMPNSDTWVRRAKITHKKGFDGAVDIAPRHYVIASTHNNIHFLAGTRHMMYSAGIDGGKGKWQSEDMPEGVGVDGGHHAVHGRHIVLTGPKNTFRAYNTVDNTWTTHLGLVHLNRPRLLSQCGTEAERECMCVASVPIEGWRDAVMYDLKALELCPQEEWGV
ncbi:hypothetical protein KIPB_001790, partial [Kipferlia bialata]